MPGVIAEQAPAQTAARKPTKNEQRRAKKTQSKREVSSPPSYVNSRYSTSSRPQKHRRLRHLQYRMALSHPKKPMRTTPSSLSSHH